MPGHRLGRIHHHPAGMLAQRRLDGNGFIQIAQRGRSPMGVEIVDLIDIDTRVVHGAEHCPSGAIHIRCGHMAGIGAHAETRQLRVNPCTTCPRMPQFLQHQDASTLAQDEAIAIAVPGSRRGRRVVVARRQGAHRGETTDAQRRNSRLGAARNDHVGVTVLNHPSGLPNAVQASRAGGRDRNIGALKAKAHRHMTGNHVDDRGGNEKWRYSPGSALPQLLVCGFDHRQPADSRTDDASDARCSLVCERIPGRQP